MSATEIVISCAKPDCHWTGSPADAPNHVCPTPEVAATDNGGRSEATTEVGGPDRESADRTATMTEPHPFAGIETADGAKIPAIDEADEPEGLEMVELWLNEYGDYSDEGVPQDEKTARLDAIYSRLKGEPADDEPELEPASPSETSSEEPEPEPELQGSGELVTSTPGPTPAEGPRPWQTVIAEELAAQPQVSQYRWLVVLAGGEHEEASLIGRGRIKSDAQEILDKVVERGQISEDDLEIVKTADVLEQAENLAARAPGESPETTGGAEATTEPPTDDEPQKTAQEAAAQAQAAAEAAEAAEPEKPGEQAQMFDKAAYETEELALPKVDGHGIDRIAVGFSGRIMLDRSDKHDVALYRKLELGKEVELRVAGRVSGTGAKGATNKEGDLDVIVGEKTISIGTVYVVTPEEM